MRGVVGTRTDGDTSADRPALSADTLALSALLDVDHPLKRETADLAAERFAQRSTTFDRDRWQTAADLGLLGLRADPRWGGAGRSSVEALLRFEGLGLGTPDNGLAFSLASQVFATQTALEEAGSDDQRDRWLRPLVDGSAIGSFAMTEPAAGSDAASITTTATPTADGFRLQGEKCWVTLGPVADLAIVFATEDPEKGPWGITAFLVPLDLPGVTVSPAIAKAGLESCPFGSITLDAEVPADAVLGRRGAGMSIFTSAVEAERAFLYGCQLGATERLLQRSIERARSRRQFDQPIGQFQAVGHRLADMKLRHETSRLLVYKAAILHDRGESVTMAAALAKLQASESAVESAVDAVRLHGAEGYTVAAGVEAEVRDALGGLAYSGTSDIQRNIVVRLLGADRPSRPSRGGTP